MNSCEKTKRMSPSNLTMTPNKKLEDSNCTRVLKIEETKLESEEATAKTRTKPNLSKEKQPSHTSKL